MTELNWEVIRNEFENTTATLKELAEKYNVSEGTVRSRKCREKWVKKEENSGQSAASPPQKKVATQREKQQEKELAKNATLQKKKGRPRIEKIIEDVVIENEDLTEKQRLFCLYYIKNFNATQAAIKAGYSPERAHVTGSELVRNSKVAAEIRRLKGRVQKEIFIDVMDVLNKYIKIAFSDITDFVTFGQKEVQVMGPFGPLYQGKGENKKPVTKIVNYVDLKDSSQIDGTIITEVSQGRDGVKIKLADKMAALEKLDKYFDLFPDQFKRRIEEEKLRLEEQRLKMSANEEGKEQVTEHARRVQEAWEKRLQSGGGDK